MKFGLSLSKALKVKNRLAGRYSSAVTMVKTYNCRIEGCKDEVNVREAYNQSRELSNALIMLKTAIYEANKGIYLIINQLSEKKSEIDFLRVLDTRNGSEPTYQGATVTYVSEIQKQEVSERVKRLEKEIDDLQDQIDKYNAGT